MISIRSWWSVFFRRQFDVRLRTGGYQTRIIERPGKWMTPAEIAELSADLRQVASKTLPAGALSYGVFSGDPKRLEQSIITVIYQRADRRPIAFNALAVMDLDLAGKRQEVLHLGLVMVDPEVRSRGLSWILYGLTCVLVFLRNQLRPVWVSNVTQVPAVVGMVSTTFHDVYPRPGPEARRSLRHLLLARQIMRHHRHVFGVGPEAGFDEDRFVITDAYTGGSDDLKKTFDAAPKHRDAQFNDFCARELDYVRGDDLLQIGQLTLQSTMSYLTNDVPRGSLAALAVAGVTIILQVMILPVLHWLNAGRQWKSLRPWRM